MCLLILYTIFIVIYLEQMTKLNVNLNVSQKLNITADLLTSIDIMEMNFDELNEFLLKESQSNVMMDYENIGMNSDKDNWDLIENIYQDKDLRDHLYEQVMMLDLQEEKFGILYFLIDNLDERGFLSLSAEEISKSTGVKPKIVTECIEILKNFDPKGIGSANMIEALLFQIDKDENLELIIKNHLKDIYEGKFNKIAKKLGISAEEVFEISQKLKKLNPIPALGFGRIEDVLYIRPEIFLSEEDFKPQILDNSLNVGINSYYLRMMKEGCDKDTIDYLKKGYNRAQFIISSIERRKRNLELTVGEIVKRQGEFFFFGGVLRPMTQAEIARELGVSASTISRIVKNKYLSCSLGVFELKYFFNRRPKSNKNISSDFIKKQIKGIIEKEDRKKPLSDEKIRKKLQNRGIDIKRRTIAKYREETRIPKSTTRRLMYEEENK
ncbi:RNA polymerase sigma-54 factor [Peptoniphilus sp. ING2-D1G]|nr:RNA polymerase sigma-54 factor [Peptoniphilus sp. ING2-D1G]